MLSLLICGRILVIYLHAARFDAAVAIVSSTEILVIGGWGGETAQERVNTVYKGIILKLADQ